jgi:hypothetical protein
MLNTVASKGVNERGKKNGIPRGCQFLCSYWRRAWEVVTTQCSVLS